MTLFLRIPRAGRHPVAPGQRRLWRGADEQHIRADGLTRLHARSVIKSEDGALMRVDSQGQRHDDRGNPSSGSDPSPL